MEYDEIDKVFEKWSAEGELKNTFFIQIGADICEQKDKTENHVLADIKDKIVEDTDNSEGTGIWSNTHATSLHVPAPTLSIATTSASSPPIAATDNTCTKPSTIPSNRAASASKTQMKRGKIIKDLRQAVYTTCLASHIQGMNIITKGNHQNKWNINFPNIIQIWRGGCIIQSPQISTLLSQTYPSTPHPKSPNSSSQPDPLSTPSTTTALTTAFAPLKRTNSLSVHHNATTPSIPGTLEYLKYSGNMELPAQFYEAGLDYFGRYIFESKRFDVGGTERPVTGGGIF